MRRCERRESVRYFSFSYITACAVRVGYDVDVVGERAPILR